MLTINLKMAKLYKVESMKLCDRDSSLFEDKFVDFAVVKSVDSNLVQDVLSDKKYKKTEKLLNDVGNIYAPEESYEPLEKYTDKRIVSREDIRKILEKKK